MPCPRCGYNEHHYKHHPLYLKPRTLLENQYILGKPLGQGGFGVTYIGLDNWLRKKVAIKEYLPAALATRDFQTANIIPLKKQESAFNQGLQSFIREARNLARFNHPNIVKVLHFFKAHQTGYMVMEYLSGTSPSTHLSVANTLAIMLPILEALAEIHAQQVYHCDISIQNIRVTENGTPVLIDFGAVRQKVGEHSRSLTLILKHGYAPLEQYSGKGNIGPWTDIYACGALFYLLLTGTLPPAATDRLNEDSLIAPIDIVDCISPTLNDAILCALALEPAQRFQSVQAFKAALQGQSPIVQLSVPTILPSSIPKKNNPFKFITLSLFLLSCGFFLITQDGFLSLIEKFFLSQKVEKLIIVAEKDNSYKVLQPVVKPVPSQKTDLQKIAQHYEQVARAAQAQGNLTISLEMVQQGLKIVPAHAELLALERYLQTQITQKQRITQLLEQADHYFNTQQLEAAYQTYQAVLQIDPHHVSAKKGLQQLAENYIQRAQQGSPVERLALVDKGLILFPHHPTLLSLQKKITTILERQQQIDHLLKKAEKYRQMLRLTEPPRANAYEIYQEVLTLMPDQSEAKAGLEKIADEYEKLARVESSNQQRKGLFIEKGLKVSPVHVGLLTLKNQLEAHKDSPKIRPATSTKKVTQLPIKLQQSVAVPTTPNPIDTTQELLTLAQQYLIEDKLDAAFQTYKNILAIDANNPQATQGLQDIASRYEQLARYQQQQANLSASLTFINKGLTIYPQHNGLVTLKEETTSRIAKKTMPKAAEITAEPIIFTPTF